MNNITFSAFPELNLDIQKNLKEDRIKALENSQKSHEANKKIFDKKKSSGDFKLGDKVYVHSGNPLNRKKLDKIRIGPFSIVRVISKSIFEVDTGKRLSLIHISEPTRPY